MDPTVSVVMVDWVDSAGNSRWDSPSEHQKMPPYRCRTFGILVRNDDAVVIVAQSLTHPMDDYEPQMNASIVIPKPAVQSIEVIYRWERG